MEKEKNVLLKTEPSMHRLIIRWAILFVALAVVITFWAVLTKKIYTAQIVIVVIFVSIFLLLGILLSIFSVKNNYYNFCKDGLLVQAGIFEKIEQNLPYKNIVFYKKVFGLADLINKKQTACFVFYTIRTSKKGKRTLVKEPIFSGNGLKDHEKISEILNKFNVKKLESNAEKRNLKHTYALEWKNIKVQNKLNKLKEKQ